MTHYETGILITTILGWIVTLIIQIIILLGQTNSQKEVAKLQNKLGARRDIAVTRLDDLSTIRKWIDKGWELYSDVFPLEIYLDQDSDDMSDPKLNIHQMATNIRIWENNLLMLSPLAEIYDPLNKNSKKWEVDFGNLPSDLPQLLKIFSMAIYNYGWEQFDDYQGHDDIPPSEYTIINGMGEYIPNLYQKVFTALERVREHVVTEQI